MNTTHFILDRDEVSEQAPPSTRLLDVLRHHYQLTGCKEACGEGDCGACMVLIGYCQDHRLRYVPTPACLTSLGAVAGCHVVSIEGLSAQTPRPFSQIKEPCKTCEMLVADVSSMDADIKLSGMSSPRSRQAFHMSSNGLNPIQQALVDEGAIQCGFCTPGLVVALMAFFLNAEESSVAAAFDAAAGNLCRCTGYSGIKRAIKALCERFDLSRSPLNTRVQDGIDWQWLPPYFATIQQRLQHLPTNETHTSDVDAVLIAGGSDAVLQSGTWQHRPVFFLEPTPDEDCVHRQGQSIAIAAGATLEQIRHSSLLQVAWPCMQQDLQRVASQPIRQHATLGGNLVNASPIADMAVWCLALDAQLHLDRHGHSRHLPLREFYLGYKHTALQAGERLQTVCFEWPETNLFSFEKVSKRPHLDIATVNSALSLRLQDDVIEDVHLAAGGVGPIPMYLQKTCEFLRGQRLSAALLREAVNIAQREVEPISDLRGSATYKHLLLRQLIYAHFLKSCPRTIHWEALYDAA